MTVRHRLLSALANTSAPAWVTFIAGGTGGSVSAILNNPIDVVKSRIQSGKASNQTGVISTMRHMLMTDGIKSFGAGLQARCVRLFVSQAIQFTIVDKIVETMKQRDLARKASTSATPIRHPSTLYPTK